MYNLYKYKFANTYLILIYLFQRQHWLGTIDFGAGLITKTAQNGVETSTLCPGWHDDHIWNLQHSVCEMG